MVPGNIGDTRNGRLEQFLLFSIIQSLQHFIPILVNPQLKLLFVASTSSTDHIDTLALNPILPEMIINQVEDHILVLELWDGRFAQG